MQISNIIERLIDELAKLPSIGHRTAARIAYYILSAPKDYAESLSQVIKQVKDEIKLCSACFNYTDLDPCRICNDPRRDPTVVCVIEEPQDLMAIENSNEFRGHYHVLHGVIAPLSGIGPEDLKIKELLTRIKTGGVKEIILATNTTVEGEATAIYISQLIKDLKGIDVTRIASGIPAGGDIEYLDKVTLGRAIEKRHPF